MVGQRHAIRDRCERGELRVAGARAGDGPIGAGELFGQLPVGRRPDVLGVRRDAPRQAAHQRRVARDAGRRVQEMRVDAAHLGRQLCRQNAGLAEAADAVRRAIAHEIAPPRAPGGGVARQPPRRTPTPEHAAGLLVEIFGQVDDRRADLVMHRMALGIGGAAHRIEADIQPPPLQGADFLGDEGFGEARIALEDESDGCGRHGRGLAPNDQAR